MRALRLISIILLFAFLGLLLIHSLDSINQDIGRHLKLGEIIWKIKSVPKTNLFSFTEPNFPFIDHHWLSEVVFYLLSLVIGLKGLIIFKAGVITASFLLIFKAVAKKAGTWPFLISAPLGILVFLNRSDVRPEIFSYLFLAFFLFAILKARFFGKCRWLYFLPFVEILWVNVHIYFILGPALLFFFLIDAALDKERKTALSKIFWVLLATSVATFLNPNFIKGALAPLFILKNYGYTIIENQSVFFLSNYGIQLAAINAFEISLIVLLIGFVIALKNGQRKIIFELLAGLAFSVLAIKMIRNTGIYALVFTTVTSLNLGALKPVVESSKRTAKIIFYLALSAIFAFLIINVLNNNLRAWMQEGGKFGLEIPAGAQGGVDFVKENNVQGPVFNDFDVGSFLIWKLYPEQKVFPAPLDDQSCGLTQSEIVQRCGVFVDGRPEAYSVDFFENIYNTMQEDPEMWKYYSENYSFDYVFFATTDITPWAQEFLSDISHNPDWPLVYKDGSAAIFLKRTPENSALIRKYEIK